MFVPFRRLGDIGNGTGVGLGLAVPRGLTEAMGGILEPEETPGGGLTITVSIPAVPGPPSRSLAQSARASVKRPSRLDAPRADTYLRHLPSRLPLRRTAPVL